MGRADKVLKRLGESIFHPRQRRCGGPEFVCQACDRTPGEAAGDDEAEVVEVGGDVECQAVHAYPASDAHAHGADLGVRRSLADGPNAGGGGVAGGCQAEGGAGLDGGVFQESHVGVQAEVEEVEVEDGVGDELSRAVVGDVPAPVGFFY